MLSLGSPNALNVNEETNQNTSDGWGSQASLVIYCCIYILRNVRKESRRLLSQSDHMVIIFRLRSIVRWKDSEHAHMCCILTHMLL